MNKSSRMPSVDEDLSEKSVEAELVFDGERFIPGAPESEIDLEHYHRYLSAIELVKGCVIADVACGAGYGSAILGKYAKQVTGIDVSEDAVASATSNFGSSNVRFQVGNCADLPFGDHSLDALVSFETLEHIIEQDEFLDECKRVLKPNGLLIISTPHRERYNAQLSEPNPHHLRELDEVEFRSALSSRFKNVDISGQRVVFGSLILSENEITDFDTLRRTNEQSIVKEPARARSIYLVAVCTDGPRQRFPAGSFEGGFPPNALSSLIGGVKDRDQLAGELRQKLADVQESRSRLGAELDLQTIETRSVRTRLEGVENERASLRQDMAALGRQLADLERRNGQLVKSQDQLSKTSSDLQAQLNRAKADLDHLQDVSDLAASLDEQLRDEREQLRSEREQLRHERDQLHGAREQNAKLTQHVFLAETRLRKERFIGKRAAKGAWRSVRNIAPIAAPIDFLTFWARTRLMKPKLALKLTRQAHAIRRSRLLDENYYLGHNFDVRILGGDPVRHYLLFGAAEGRDPSADFSSEGYWRANADVALRKDNPLYHYVRYGKAEGRPLGAVRGASAYQMDVSAGQGSTKNNEVLTRLRKSASDPYSVRPDDVVFSEASRGEAFLSRHNLLSSKPDFASAQRAFSAAEFSPALASGAGTSPTASVIVPVYGQLAYTLNCLDSLLRHASKHAFEVIVIDDCSPDESQRWLSQVPGIRYVRQTENQGFLKTCNDAVEMAQGDYVVLLNNDTRVVDGWLDEMIDSFGHFPKAGLVGSKLFYPDGALQEAGGIIWQDGSAWNFGRNDDPNKPEYCYARRVDYVSGAAIAVPKDLWDKLGGFDEAYRPAYCEDSDLAFRIRAADREVWMQPASRIIHYEGKSSGTDVSQGVKSYQVVNSKTLYEKWKHVLASHRPNAVDPQFEKDRLTPKRVLVIDATTPTPDQDAGSVTTWMNLMIFRDLGFASHFVPQDNMLFQKRYTVDLQRQGIECHYAPFDFNLEELLQREGSTFDFVMIFRSNVTHIALPLLRKYAPQAAVAFNNMDLHYLRLQRQADLTGDQKVQAEADRYKQLEFDVIRSVDCTVVPSYEEAAILQKELPGAPVIVLPYMTDIVGTAQPFETRKDFVFVGGYNHSPNVDAVEFFVEKIWPTVKAGAPEAKFYIVGSNPPQRVLDLASESIIVTGRVDDLQPYLDRSRVCVCPIRYGAGVKGKVTTAMAHGLPVVATTIAAEGMGVVVDRDLLVADDPAAFAEATLRAYRDPQLWERLSKAGMAFATEHNSIHMGKRVIGQIIEKASAVHASRKRG